MLVIEDNKAIASVIEHIGKSLGFQVTTAHSFSEVKKLLVSHQEFFVATVDYGLPDAPEGEVIPYVLDHGIPSVVMTGRMNDKIHQTLLNLPIIDYITKESSQAYHYLLRVLHGQLVNHKTSVLVVDDSLSVRSYVCSLLKRRNFTVFEAANGVKALQLLKENAEIKLLITDQEMPEMTGIELVQAIRKRFTDRDLIIIGYSGIDKVYQSARFIKSGADDYLKKPFCPEEFYCRIFKNIEQLHYIEEIKMAANVDYLTSLSNRRYFIDQFDELFAEILDSHDNYILALFHVDDFMTINDDFGHSAGDQVLIEFSRLLSCHFNGQLLARFGGAEFGCLLSGEDFSKNEQCLLAFKESVSKHSFAFEEREIKCSICIGGTIISEQSSVHQCLEQSDEALQQAQAKGQNQMVLNGFVELSE
ncbi:response regulator/GGDEF domain protein [Shewanella sediminis HAW-EB3]|uniref:Response regulator/GGDEF domain protein n=1 Tax=Shewanella sediminis (strain HAW-EB3) TaxID=425104 RepID=A8FYM7_SHESH|nr:diguanylate cyclase [Shewanella sediminis]ABV37950.1 response regulator/GGDEF domain protein [Shewanella sediminis HAW-EB3]